ncbi:MAG: hypothetical protein ACD_73C00089G0001 [uncultured bacterium]|nr:MAG: hypothetical protein ACD_73C00089G0001 [uncultured bacterium]
MHPATEAVWIKTIQNGDYELLDYKAKINHPFYKALYQGEDLEAFALELDLAPSSEKLRYLNTLARLLYGLYDAAGLGIASGSGEVNTVSREELYTTVRESVVKDIRDRKTVCRGIAPFIANLAHRWGFEAYTAKIQTNGNNHVVTLLKEKGAAWNVINYGKNSFVSNDQSISQTLDDFAAASGYPPQPFYELYDHNGNYLRRIETSFGNTLFDKTTAPEKLKGFLMGADAE